MNDNEAIARYVMGWQMEGHFLHVWWEDEKHRSQIRAVDWHPDTNLSQAMQVAEAMRVKNWYVALLLHPDSYQWEKFVCMATRYRTQEHPKTHIDGNGDTLESAIHAAAMQVARAMEAQS